MKRVLSLLPLGVLPLIPAVSCTTLSISNENPEINNWNEAISTIGNNKTLVDKIEKEYVRIACNQVINPISFEVVRVNDQLNLFEEIEKGTIIVESEDFTYPTYIIGNEFNVNLKAFTITNLSLCINAKFELYYTKEIKPEDKIKITLDQPIQFKTTTKFWEGVK